MKKTFFNKLFSIYMASKLGRCGADFHVKKGSCFYRAKNVSVGSGVRVGEQCDFYVNPRQAKDEFPLKIGDGCHLGHRTNLACIHSLIIENKVMIGNDVYISDHGHEYRDADLPIIDQPVTESKETIIGEGAWIGAKAIILPGASIGQHSVVGAGAVVTKPVADFTVVGGNPAVPLRRYDVEKKEWVRVQA